MSPGKKWSFSTGEYITAMDWLRDGSAVVAAPGTGGLLLLDPANGRVRAQLRGHTPGNSAVAAGNGLLATAGQDGLACLWRPDTHELLTELRAAKIGREWCEKCGGVRNAALRDSPSTCISPSSMLVSLPVPAA
jgi:hypothetical protein